MLHERGFSNTRLWPRGVDLKVFNPARRSQRLRQSYGIIYPNTEIEVNPNSQPSTIPLQAPSSPVCGPAYKGVCPPDDTVVILSVGRMYVGLYYLPNTHNPRQLLREEPCTFSACFRSTSWSHITREAETSIGLRWQAFTAEKLDIDH